MNLKSLLSRLHTILGGWPMRLAVLGCYLLAFVYFLLVALMIWKGDTWAYIVYAENPYAHLAGGIGFLLLGHILRFGHRYGARDWGRLAGKAVMLAISSGLALFAGEVGLRMILIKQQEMGSIERLRDLESSNKKIPIRSTHPLAVIIELSRNLDLVYELKPNLEMEFGHKLLRTNSRGMRSDREFTDEKPTGTVRIIGIGDSGMFGWNVEQGEEYMAVLERTLNARGDGIAYETMNLAVPGYNTALEVESLVYKGLALNPDIVIVGWCDNDYQLPFFMLEKENFRRTDRSFLLTYLFDRKQVAEMVSGRRVRSMRNYNRDMVEEEIVNNAGMDGVRTALARLKALSEEHGFRLLVIGPLRDHIKAILADLGLEQFNTYSIDASAYPKEYAIHYMHPRPGGHAVIGEKLAEDLDRRGWLQPER